MSGYVVRAASEWPERVQRASDAAAERAWPEFLRHGAVAGVHWPQLWTRFADYQFALIRETDEAIVAVAHSVPLAWQGRLEDLPEGGWDWAMEDGMRAHDARGDTMSALAIIVLPEHQGQGLGGVMVEAMRAVGQRHGHARLVVPLRPTLKDQYPLTPMARYVRWRDAEGLPFDPWLRLHVRLGAAVVGVCSTAYRVEGTVAQWEARTGMVFPESGAYIVPGALHPVDVDLAADHIRYVEANIWVSHSIGSDVGA